MIITEFDTVFSDRTGVTVLLPKTTAFDPGTDGKNAFKFHINKDKGAVTVAQNGSDRVTTTLESVDPDILTAITDRGLFMVYELDQDDEIVRISICESSDA